MNIKKIHYNHLKPQNYYNRLLTFFLIIGFITTLTLVGFNLDNMELFLLKYIIILFLLLCVAVVIEFFYRSDYMNPIEIFEIESFFNVFRHNLRTDSIEFDNFFNKYDVKSKKVLEKMKKKKTRLLLSSIRKHGDVYEVTFFDERKMLEFYIVKFLAKGGVHKMFIKDIKGKLRIIRLA